jgi:hypothetical protein
VWRLSLGFGRERWRLSEGSGGVRSLNCENAEVIHWKKEGDSTHGLAVQSLWSTLFLVLPSWEGTISPAFMSLTFPSGSLGLYLHWNICCD